MDAKINKNCIYSFSRIKNKGQITIFVIIGLAIIALVSFLILYKLGKIPSIIGGFEENPQKYLENCIEPKIQEGVSLLLKQGGYTEPKLYKNFKFSDDKNYYNISFLCYTSKNYLTCINREPVLITHLEEEIYNYISEDIKKCFDKWENTLEKNRYIVNSGNLNYSINLEPRKIIIKAEKETSVSKKTENFEYKEFKIVISDKIYDLAIVSQEILSQEAEYCNFDILGFMLFYKGFDIDKFRTSDLNTIYTIIDKKTKEKFRFAVRGCVIPARI